MKLRIIDTRLVPALRRPTDSTWDQFANHLITAFGDVTHQNGFSIEEVELVYCTHRMREIDEQILDSLVYNVPPAFVSLLQSEAQSKEKSAHSYFDGNLRWQAGRDSPFLLLGYVGTGKTTFLDHYFYVHLPKARKDIVFAFVDFKTAPDRENELVLHMIEQVDRCLSDLAPDLAGFNRNTLEVLYAEEVASIRACINAIELQELEIDRLFALVLRARGEKDIDRYARHIAKKIATIQESGRQLWVILDNIDQHYHSLHHNVFVNAVSIANGWKCPLIISMRYVTLHTPAARQAYDSYRPRRLKLSLPNVAEMIEKRVSYFKYLADPLLSVPLPSTAGTLKVSDLAKEIRDCAALIGSPEMLQKLLLPLANYNLRRFLEIVLSALQSYYFYFDRFNGERYLPNERIIWKRLMFANLLKNNDYFDPSSRNDQELFIVNLFENENQASPLNQTIRIRVLQCMLDFGRHISMSRLVERLNGILTIDQDDLWRAIRTFIEKELIAIKNTTSATFDDAVFHTGIREKDLFRDDLEVALTYCGRLHYEFLFELEYVEIMKMSTYVDPKTYQAIQDSESRDTFDKRSKSTRLFIEYLVREEEREEKEYVRDSTKFHRIMPTIANTIYNKLELVSNLPERRRGT